MAYASTEDVRLICGLTTTQISDSDLNNLINIATAQVNEDTSTLIEDESIIFVSTEKGNYINGTNFTFYTRNEWLGDYNNDGIITKDDVYVYSIDGNGLRTVLTVDSVDYRIGKFVLHAAPVNVRLYCTYRKAPVDMMNDTLVKLATSYLAAGFAYSKVNVGAVRSFSVGKISVTKDNGFDKMYSAYANTIQKISKNWLGVGESADVV